MAPANNSTANLSNDNGCNFWCSAADFKQTEGIFTIFVILAIFILDLFFLVFLCLKLWAPVPEGLQSRRRRPSVVQLVRS